MLNNQEHFLTFFRDVRFGVLYEQLKAQEQLKSMVNNTFIKMVEKPMKIIIKTID